MPENYNDMVAALTSRRQHFAGDDVLQRLRELRREELPTTNPFPSHLSYQDSGEGPHLARRQKLREEQALREREERGREIMERMFRREPATPLIETVNPVYLGDPEPIQKGVTATLSDAPLEPERDVPTVFGPEGTNTPFWKPQPDSPYPKPHWSASLPGGSLMSDEQSVYDALMGTVGFLSPLPGPSAVGSVLSRGGGFMRQRPADFARNQMYTEPLSEATRGIPRSTAAGLTHTNIPPARGSGRAPRLTPEEQTKLASMRLGVEEAATKAAEIVKYKAQRSPEDGWQPFHWAGVDAKGKAKWRGAGHPGGFNYHLDIDGKQLSPAARSTRVESLSTRMQDEVLSITSRAKAGDENARYVLDQARWYTTMRDRMRNVFADYKGPGSIGYQTDRMRNSPGMTQEQLHELYANLQGATSPNTRLKSNFDMGDEAFHRFLAGDFDDQLARFKAYMGSGGSVNKVPDDMIIRKTNGMKFGQNGKNAMMAMLGMLDDIKPGMAPKMRNYAKNIAGKSNRATIDVWAARTIQRLMHDETPAPMYARPIPEFNVVGGEHIKPGSMKTGEWKGQHYRPEITNAYGVGLDVFERAAARMDMPPNDLQALMWFGEKELWERARWSPADQAANLSDLFARKYGLISD